MRPWHVIVAFVALAIVAVVAYQLGHSEGVGVAVVGAAGLAAEYRRRGRTEQLRREQVETARADAERMREAASVVDEELARASRLADDALAAEVDRVTGGRT